MKWTIINECKQNVKGGLKVIHNFGSQIMLKRIAPVVAATWFKTKDTIYT